MPASEIDAIFASKKSRPRATVPSPNIASSSTPPVNPFQSKKKKRKVKETHLETATPEAHLTGTKRPAPETVIDSSSLIPAKRAKPTAPPSRVRFKDQPTDAERFQDSRGSGPRRKTDEGWSIYKEDELGIGDEGGETPLCPFDCECCF